MHSIVFCVPSPEHELKLFFLFVVDFELSVEDQLYKLLGLKFAYVLT